MRAQVYSGVGVESPPVWAVSTFMLLPSALETLVKMDVGGRGKGQARCWSGLWPGAHCCPPPRGAGLELRQPREEGPHSVSRSSEPMGGHEAARGRACDPLPADLHPLLTDLHLCGDGASEEQ